MKIIVCLPKITGFDIELDNQSVHSKYENNKKSVFLKKGRHTLSIHDQSPTPSFWTKIISFLNPISETIDDFSTEISFTVLEDITVTIDIVYGDFSQVDINLSESLSQIITFLD